MIEMERSVGMFVDDVEEVEDLELNRRKAHNLALVKRRRLVLFPTLSWKLLTPSPTIVGSTTLLLLHPISIDQISIRLQQYYSA